jgi:large subunit ribosomal protein L18
MEKNLKRRTISRKRRVFRVRKKLRGDATTPRFCITKSNKNIFVQLIDDENHNTIVSHGTIGEKIRLNKESAKNVGLKIAEMAKGKKIENVIFDRGRFQYHGIVAQVAEGAREGGLKF